MNNFNQRSITACIIATSFWITFFHCPPHVFSAILGTILAIILVGEWKNFFPLSNPLFWIILPCYPVAPFVCLIALNESPIHRILVYYLIVTVFTFDSVSYLFGKRYGTTKIIPSISPGKSWQGACAGYAATIGILAFLAWQQNSRTSFHAIFLLATMICMLAFAGDIFESFLKRSAQIKDSSNLLPGHGGFLDRFDAVMIVSIFFFIYKNRLIQLLIN